MVVVADEAPRPPPDQAKLGREFAASKALQPSANGHPDGHPGTLLLRDFGRDAGIRTRDPLNPIQVRYQTAPRPDRRAAFEQGAAPLSNAFER